MDLFSMSDVSYCQENISNLIAEYVTGIKNQSEVNDVMSKFKDMGKKTSFIKEILRFILTVVNSVIWTVYLDDVVMNFQAI